MNRFEKLIEFLDSHYYGDLIQVFFELIAIIAGLFFARKYKIGVFFLAYLIFDLFILICDDYIKISPSFSSNDYSFFVSLTNTLISLIELLVYYYFFFHLIQYKSIIKLMKILRMIFIALMVIFITTKFSFLTKRYSYVANIIGTIEFLFLLPPCFVYFYEIFKKNPLINLSLRPSFWIVLGIFFYSVLSIPYYLITMFFLSNQYENSRLLELLFFDIPFTINFIFLTRAFLCKKTLTM